MDEYYNEINSYLQVDNTSIPQQQSFQPLAAVVGSSG